MGRKYHYPISAPLFLTKLVSRWINKRYINKFCLYLVFVKSVHQELKMIGLSLRWLTLNKTLLDDKQLNTISADLTLELLIFCNWYAIPYTVRKSLPWIPKIWIKEARYDFMSQGTFFVCKLNREKIIREISQNLH